MSGAWHFIHHLFWNSLANPDVAKRAEWRDAIHESHNVAQVSYGAARRSKRASDEAYRVAQCTVKLLEGERDEPKK